MKFSSGFRKIDGNFARNVVDKPIEAVSSTFGRYRVALGLHVDAFWKKNTLVVFGAGGVFVCIFLWMVMFALCWSLSEGMDKINPDKVYWIATRKLNTYADILEVMGAPLAGSDLRSYVMSGGGITFKKILNN